MKQNICIEYFVEAYDNYNLSLQPQFFDRDPSANLIFKC